MNNIVNHRTGKTVHWLSVAQFALSLMAIFGLWSISFILAMAGLTSFFMDPATTVDPLPLFMLAFSTMATGVMILPSVVFSLARILDNSASRRLTEIRIKFSNLKPALWILAFPIIVLLGYWAGLHSNIAWLILPPLHVLAVVIPIVWVLFLTIRNLPLGSPQRKWGAFSTGLFLSPAIILIFECLAALVFLIVGVLVVSSQPEIVDQLISLSEWLSESNPPPEMIIERLGPYFTRPSSVFIALFFGALVIPLIEEIFKPIGVWFLFGKKISPAAGFATGALSGAGYAIFESLTLTSSGQEWTALVLARVGTGSVHILTAGLVGWALVQVWSNRRYGLLVASYLLAVSIHGLWNALTLTTSFAILAGEFGVQSNIPLISKIGSVAPFALATLAIGTFFTLLRINHSLMESPQRPSILSNSKTENGLEDDIQNML